MHAQTRFVNVIVTAVLVVLGLPCGAQVAHTTPDPDTNEPASSSTARRPASSRWAEADANGDGKVTGDELRRLVEVETKRGFARFDTNRNGQVERHELPQLAEWIKAFNRLDMDSSGGLSFDEGRWYFEQRARTRFEKLDANADGLLTSDELAPAAPVSTVERNMERDGDGDGLLSVSELAFSGDVAYFEDLHIRADVDGNGTISRTELADEYRRRAIAKDADEDGGVTLEEYTAGQGEAGRKVAELTFAELDRDGDGRITEEDLLTRPPERALTPTPEEKNATPESP